MLSAGRRTSERVLESGYCTLKECKHGPMIYNVNDMFVGRSLDFYGEWCEAELDILGQFIKPGDVIIDAGAYIGTHSIFFARKTGKDGTVLAFEPQRFPYYFLCGNVALNGLVNIKPLRAVLGDGPGKIKVPALNPLTKQNFGALDIEKEGGTKGEIIEVMSVDSLNLHKCDLIKIDVEGMESTVLRGARKTIERSRPIMLVENNTPEKSREILSMLFKLGYNCWWLIVDYFNEDNFFGNKENVFSDILPEINLMCLPEESGIEPDGLMEVEGIDDNCDKALERYDRGEQGIQ